MRGPNKNGFVIEGTFVIVALIAAATLAVFTLTPAKHLINVGGGDGQKTTQTKSYRETMIPYTENGQAVRVANPDGTRSLLFKQIVEENTLDERVQPKLPWWQRIINVGWWWVGLTIAGMIFAPLGVVMSAVNGRAKLAAMATANLFKAKHQNLSDEAKRIVVSVDAGLDVFDAEIAAAKGTEDTAVKMAALTVDPVLLQNYAAIEKTGRAVREALEGAKKKFLAALRAKQDQSTVDAVVALRNGGLK